MLFEQMILQLLRLFALIEVSAGLSILVVEAEVLVVGDLARAGEHRRTVLAAFHGVSGVCKHLRFYL